MILQPSHPRKLRTSRNYEPASNNVMTRAKFVLFRFDYCIVVLAGLPSSPLIPLQLALHAAVTGPRDHTLERCWKHYLLIEYKTKFTLCLYTVRCRTNARLISAKSPLRYGHLLSGTGLGKQPVAYTTLMYQNCVCGTRVLCDRSTIMERFNRRHSQHCPYRSMLA